MPASPDSKGSGVQAGRSATVWPNGWLAELHYGKALQAPSLEVLRICIGRRWSKWVGSNVLCRQAGGRRCSRAAVESSRGRGVEIEMVCEKNARPTGSLCGECDSKSEREGEERVRRALRGASSGDGKMGTDSD